MDSSETAENLEAAHCSVELLKEHRSTLTARKVADHKFLEVALAQRLTNVVDLNRQSLLWQKLLTTRVNKNAISRCRVS